jgi:CHAT domain-containing protein/tetratricopeptide (TPR) repeat protein
MLRIAAVVLLLGTCGCAKPVPQPRDPATEATAALRRGDVAQAEQIVRRAIAETPPDASDTLSRLRLLRGDVLLAQRDVKAATEIASAPLPEGPSSRPLRVRQQYLQARIAYSQGRLADALTLASGALNDVGDADSDREIRLDIGGFVGQIALQQGRWEDGEARLELVAGEAASSHNPYIEAMAATSLGMGKFVRNRCDEALPRFERVLALSSIADTTLYARALYNAGMCYARLGQFDKAVEVQQRAVTASEGRPNAPEYERALGQLGNTYILQGNTREGLPFFQRAFTLASDAHLAADAALWAGNLAVAYIDLQQWDDAQRFNEAAKRLAAASRSGRSVYNTENSAGIAAGRGEYADAVRLYEEVLADKEAPPSVQWHAHYGLARVALARNQTAAASRHFEAALHVIERARAGLLRDDYKISYLTHLIAFYRAYVDVLIGQGQTDRALEMADSSRGQLLAARQAGQAPQRASVAAFTRLARETGTVFLSYWLTPGNSYLWVVDASGATLLRLPSAKEIDPLVRDHAAALANAMVDPLAATHSPGEELYRLVVQPASKWLPPDARVVVVPDGTLSSINMETLPVAGGARHYWLEDVELQVAPSLASLAGAAAAVAPTGSMLLIGNPSPRPPDFPALPSATREMSSIAAHFGGDRVTAIDGGSATPQAYRSAHPEKFSYLHFTAHAVANVESPLDSAVILSGPEGAYKLYARDVAALPLAADLVTVSACRSAGERAYSGEGLVGFAWAFLRAGARRVIAGLWDVNDRSTAALMDRVYAGIAAGDRPAHALRAAKLAMLRQGGAAASPYNWGPFELFTVAIP